MSVATDKPEYTLGQQEAAHLREMEDAFLHRPRLSIRLRIVTGFLLCFFLLATTGLINLAILYRARGKAHFLDVAQEMSLAVEQARHLGRLAYPDRENLRRARDSAKQASDLLVAESVSVLDVSGQKELVALNYKLGHYVQLLDDALAALGAPAPDAVKQAALASELDARSGEIMDLLRTMKSREAAGLNRVLKISQQLPFIFAGLMLLVIFWIANLLVNTITDSLNRLEESTRRIAAGDFSLMHPARRYRDELSNLSLAVNRMLLELRAREAQVLWADKLASVGGFTVGIAHEFGEMFGKIDKATRAFLEESAPTEECAQCKLVQETSAAAEAGRATIESLLQFANDEALELGSVDLREVAASAQSLAQQQMTEAGVVFRNEVPDTMPPVRAAFGPLKHTFLNIFRNAVQAMPDGGTLTVTAGFLGPGQVEVEVNDQGTGIRPEDLPHVFEPSFTTRDGGAATGLGLSIAYSIVKRFGGEIRVDSVPGRGTTVHITLPLAKEPTLRRPPSVGDGDAA